MTDKLLALVDASAYAGPVCELAAWVSQHSGAAVEVLHVLGRREAAAQQDLSGAIRLGARTALLEELADLDARRARVAREQGRALLDDARALTEAAGASGPVGTRLMQGDLVDAVTDPDAGTRMVLIGKRGEAADFARGHLGSNLERVVRASPRPVLVAARSFRPIRRVLLAFDGGASARKAVDEIATGPMWRGLDLTLVSVGPEDQARRAALDAAASRLASAGIEVTARRIEGTPDTALAELAATGDFDLLVMGAYGHSRIRSLMIGSTTTQMIRACRMPVLLIR